MVDQRYKGFYAYNPDQAAAIAFAVLFGILTLSSCVQIVKVACVSKKRIYAWKSAELLEENSALRYFSATKLRWTYFPFILGIVLEFLGYVLRVVTINRPVISTFIAQSVFVLIAPSLYSASIFMLFSRMVYLMFMERYMVISIKYSTLTFLVGDMIGRILQATGGGLSSSSGSRNTGRILVIVGLFIQIFFYGVLMFSQIFFHYKMKTAPSKILRNTNGWYQFNYILLSGNILIIARSVVRVIEFIMGLQSYISQHEWCLYVFDTAPMFLLPSVFLICFHSRSVFKMQEKSVGAQLPRILDTNIPLSENQAAINLSYE
ncbi:hypothetical protein SMKI_12G1190 [Saccharomyces mikatae IFO 1815]|uniref:Uncharacterized protein n=1 Tax=Saccharomyces mikatae IFO 1815 TaxID=226126 RepID=A0AA35ND14_SACMI|nr:uncharacterized protein SMKI_12G1190 [Saccharomyces mikatae IFO 1815]CAI4034982.1 hypothetical protein SMKI_12G1190 [Saccharomyces mikatae IFO 1815]